MVTGLNVEEDSPASPCLPLGRVMLQTETCIEFSAVCIVECLETNRVYFTIGASSKKKLSCCLDSMNDWQID